jgi:WD40 repeat protein
VRHRPTAIILVCALAGHAAHAQPRETEVALMVPSPVVATMFAKNGSVAAAVSADFKLRLWDVASASLLRAIDVAGREVAITAMSDDGRYMLMGDYHGQVTVWNVASGQVQLELHLDRYLTAAAFSHDGARIAIAPGSPVVVYDLLAKRPLYELEPTTGSNAVAFSRDGALVASGDGDAIRVYDARSGKLVCRNAEFLAAPLAVDFTPDDKFVVAGGGDRAVLLIETASGKTIRRMTGLTQPVFYLEVSPDGRELAVVTQNADNAGLPAPVLLADLPSLRRRTNWMSPSGVLVPGGAAWNPAGHFVAATFSAGALHLWRVREAP